MSFPLFRGDGAAKLAALDKSQATIEFKLDGTIITANANFLNAMGYTLAEVQGKHHSMFVEPAYKESAEYREFWAKLGRGEYQAAQYKRIGKGGKEVWIEASYNPLLTAGGKPLQSGEVCNRRLEAEGGIRRSPRQDRSDRPLPGRDRVQSRRDRHHRQREFPESPGLFACRDPGQAPQHVRRARLQEQRRVSRVLGQAQSRRISGRSSTSGSARAARRSGSRPRTTRSWI
jgi:PAS domain S-box-containing protein